MATRFDDWEGEALQHYGVLGMKWGVRKDPNRAYERATAKLGKLQKKRTKAELDQTKASLKMQKALAKQTKVENKRVGPDDPGYESYRKKSAKAYSAASKATKAYNGAKFVATQASYNEQKWKQSMLKAFGANTYEELQTKYANRVQEGKEQVERALSGKKRS